MTALALALALVWTASLIKVLRLFKTTPPLRSDRSNRVTIFSPNR